MYNKLFIQNNNIILTGCFNNNNNKNGNNHKFIWNNYHIYDDMNSGIASLCYISIHTCSNWQNILFSQLTNTINIVMQNSSGASNIYVVVNPHESLLLQGECECITCMSHGVLLLILKNETTSIFISFDYSFDGLFATMNDDIYNTFDAHVIIGNRQIQCKQATNFNVILNYSTTILEKMYINLNSFFTLIDTLDLIIDNIDNRKNSSNTLATIIDPFYNDINNGSLLRPIFMQIILPVSYIFNFFFIIVYVVTLKLDKSESENAAK